MSECYSLSLGERVRVKASQKLYSPLSFSIKVRPHPGPLPPRRGRILVRLFCESDTFVKARPTVGDGERDVRIIKQMSECYSLSLGERVRVRASQKLYSPLPFSIKVRPHPSPLPQGEGESSSVFSADQTRS